MTVEDIRNKFEELRLASENETVEFKEAKESFDFHTLGKYFSALSNEANLQGALRLACVRGSRQDEEDNRNILQRGFEEAAIIETRTCPKDNSKPHIFKHI